MRFRAETLLILVCGAIWLITKTVLMYLVPLETNVAAGTMLNLFFILLIAIFSIHRRLRVTGVPENNSFLDDLKAVMRNTARYALLATLLIGVFVYVIGKDEYEARQYTIEQEIDSYFSNEEAYQNFIIENPQYANVDREEARSEALESFRLYGAWYVQGTLALVGLLVFATLSAIFSTLLWRNLFGA